jgi:hypothetical protein
VRRALEVLDAGRTAPASAAALLAAFRKDVLEGAPRSVPTPGAMMAPAMEPATAEPAPSRPLAALPPPKPGQRFPWDVDDVVEGAFE